MKEKDFVCEFCHWETDEIVNVSPPYHPYNGDVRQVCKLCHHTVSASWYQDDRTYTREESFVLRHINASLNYVLEQLKHG